MISRLLRALQRTMEVDSLRMTSSCSSDRPTCIPSLIRLMRRVINIGMRKLNRPGKCLIRKENSRFIIFSVAKATLQSQMSVCLSVSLSITKTPQPLRIKSISHYDYLLVPQIPISHQAQTQPLCQSAIMPISHCANQPQCFPLSLSEIMLISHHANQPP